MKEKSKIATSKWLSQVLLSYGIDKKTADMYYPVGSSFPEVCDNGDNMQCDFPAWSLDALINLLYGWEVGFYFDGDLYWHCQCWRRVGKTREAIAMLDYTKIDAICRVIIRLRQEGKL